MKIKTNEVVGDYTMKASRRNDAPGNLRVGMKVVGSRGNVLSDEETEAVIPTAVCIIVVREDGKVLSVSHGDDENDLNLPGGGIETGELPEEAARRELWEETGMIATELLEVYRGVGRSRLTVVFKANDADGNLRNSPEGKVAWVNPKKLLVGTYGNFFAKLLRLGYV